MCRWNHLQLRVRQRENILPDLFANRIENQGVDNEVGEGKGFSVGAGRRRHNGIGPMNTQRDSDVSCTGVAEKDFTICNLV